MITNERQYRITRAQLRRFEEALSAHTAVAHQGVDLRLVTAEREALASQILDLRSELEEYERWKASDISMITVSSFDELALGLIRARIASGLTQRDLAERLDLKEQQIQKYESEYYRSASYRRLRDVADALGVRIRNDILLPIAPASFQDLVSKLRQVGLHREFLLQRLMSPADVSRTTGEVPTDDQDLTLASIGATLSRVFGWTPTNIFGAQPLVMPELPSAHARFKMPAYCTSTNVRTYIAYANYLAGVVVRGSSLLPIRSHSDNAQDFRTEMLKKYGTISFKNLLDYAWDLGIPVLPLHDPGHFHGACWRFDHRNVIVLKQQSGSRSRWMFDLLHELYHAAQQAQESSLSIIEAPETSVERRESDEEKMASHFAANVILDGKAEELAEECTSAASGGVECLKQAVSHVAAKHVVDVGSLANYMAFRLSWQNIEWWGAAQSLQEKGPDPWQTASDVFFKRFPFAIEDAVDSGLLHRALGEIEYEEPS